MRKAKTRRPGRAAFAKITAGVLLELGLHNPLVAAIGRGAQSGMGAGAGIAGPVARPEALLLADRATHGCCRVPGGWLQAVRQKVGSTLFGAGRKPASACKPSNASRTAAGWCGCRCGKRAGSTSSPAVAGMVREIRVRVQRTGHRPQELRLWTSLLDPGSAPARELIPLYARRWEHELYYRELKRQLRKSEVLQSHTLETGAQEIAALVLASALLARERARAAAGQTPVLRVSFIKTLELMRPLWLTLALGGDLLSPLQKQQLTQRFLERARQYVTPRRKRPRSCPRAVRRPVSGWPRLQRNQSWEGPIHFDVPSIMFFPKGINANHLLKVNFGRFSAGRSRRGRGAGVYPFFGARTSCFAIRSNSFRLTDCLVNRFAT